MLLKVIFAYLSKLPELHIFIVRQLTVVCRSFSKGMLKALHNSKSHPLLLMKFFLCPHLAQLRFLVIEQKKSLEQALADGSFIASCYLCVLAWHTVVAHESNSPSRKVSRNVLDGE